MLEVAELSRREYRDEISWIAPEGVSAMKGCHFRARRSFEVGELSASRLYIAAESYYVLYVNGRMAGVGPARGTCGCNFLDEYDLSDFTAGETLFIAVELFCNNFNTFIASPAEPALFVRIDDNVTDASWQVQIADDWCHTDVPNYTFQIGLMEWRDYRKTPADWQVFDDDSVWQQAKLIEKNRPIYAKKLFYRDVAMMDVTNIKPKKITGVYSVLPVGEMLPDKIAETMSTEELTPLQIDLSGLCNGESVVIPPQPDGNGVVLIVDPQQAYIGGFELDITAQPGTIVDVGNDEDFVDGRLVFKRHDYYQTDRYIHSGGRHIISNPLHYRGGRYLQFAFRSFDAPIILHRLELVDRRYPVKSFAGFDCDNGEYNALWKRCTHTMSTCATDTFIDCPWREQAFWVNDFMVQNVYWFELTGNSELVRRSMDTAMSQQIDEGLIPGVCPFDGRRVHVLFATNLFLPIILRNYLRYTGDRKYVDAVLPTITDIFKCCQKYADDEGLLTAPDEFWNFVDWGYLLQDPTLQAYPLNGRNTCVVNWFNVLACDALSELSNDTCVADKYKSMAGQIATAIEKRFWSEDESIFYEWLGREDDKGMAAGSLTHSLAILSGRLSSEKVEKVKAALCGGELYHPELFMLLFVMEALAEIGEHSQVVSLIEKYWFSMLTHDTPAIWEANVYKHGKEALWGLGSMCHAFALSPVNYFQKYILGIKPLADGLKCFTFSPNVAGLNEASGSVPTSRGWIKIHWKIVDGNIIANLDIPADTSAILPNGVEFGAGRHEIKIEKKTR